VEREFHFCLYLTALGFGMFDVIILALFRPLIGMFLKTIYVINDLVKGV